MLWWLFVLLLFYASARWTAVNVAIRVVLLAFAVVGLLLMLQTGFIPVFLQAILEIPVLFFQGIFGIIKAILFP